MGSRRLANASYRLDSCWACYPAPIKKDVDMTKPLNPRFYQAMAIAKAIPKRKNKKLAILAWCVAAKRAING